MATAIPDSFGSVTPAPRAKAMPEASGSIGSFRLATDPLFYGNLTLTNVVTGSRYLITRNDTGAVVDSGVAASSTVAMVGLPIYTDPMPVTIRVRKGTSAPKYQPYETQASLARAAQSTYIAQVADTIA